ncbi:MAG: hypothetical protein ACKPKO_19580, partial [Candidatus Fonsibacter sp.]
FMDNYRELFRQLNTQLHTEDQEYRRIITTEPCAGAKVGIGLTTCVDDVGRQIIGAADEANESGSPERRAQRARQSLDMYLRELNNVLKSGTDGQHTVVARQTDTADNEHDGAWWRF